MRLAFWIALVGCSSPATHPAADAGSGSGIDAALHDGPGGPGIDAAIGIDARDACTTCGTLYPITVTTSGLTSGSVSLANGTDSLAITANGTTMFANQLADHDPYDVSITAQPATSAHLHCQLGGATSGSISAAPVVLTLDCTSTNGPALRVIVAHAAASNGGTVHPADVAPDHAAAFPVILQNVGTADLHFALPLTIGSVSGGTMAMRDQPMATIAPGETTVATFVATAPASGSYAGTLSIASDDPTANPFTVTVQGQVLPTASVLYTLDGRALFAATLAGASTQLTPVNPSAALYGPSAYYQHGTHALFHGNFTTASVDAYAVGIPPNTAPLQNLSASITGATGWSTDLAFAGQTALFAATAGGSSQGPYQLYAVDLSTDTVGAPVSLTGPPPVGAVGAGAAIVSPFGDRVAYLGDFATAGVFDLYALDLPSGTPAKVSLPFVGTSAGISNVVWGADDRHLIYEVRTQPCAAPQFDLFWVDLVTHTTTQLNGAITGCHPPTAGVSPGAYQISTSGHRVAFRSNQGLATNQIELFVTTNLGGAPTTVGVNGATVPGTKGVQDSAMDSSGARILFTADGAGGARDLYYTSMAGGVATTTRVLTVASPSTTGVTLFGAKTFPTDTRAIFALDDLVAGQSRLFTVDLSAAPATFAPVLVPGSGAFPSSGTGLTSTNVRALAQVTPDGTSVVWATDQGSATAGHLQLYSSPLVAPATAVLGSAGNDVFGIAPLAGTTVAFTQLAASAKPISVWRNTINHTGETQLSGAEIAGMSVATKLEAYSATRTLYFVQDSTGVAQLWTNLSGVSTLLSGSSGTGNPQIGFKTNAD